MISTAFTALLAAASASVASAGTIPRRSEATSGHITPHPWFSSSSGVLGCKVNTNRFAYWSTPVSCDNICLSISHGGRNVKVLHFDQSEGANDISYDAWNYLVTGQSATENPTTGGQTEATWEYVDPSECHELLDNGKVPLDAANSMNYVTECLSQPDSYVAKNMVLYNIQGSGCQNGVDEECHLDLAVSNQPQCPSTLGHGGPLKGHTVMDIAYGTGEKTPVL